jgi:hypothetical protein
MDKTTMWVLLAGTGRYPQAYPDSDQFAKARENVIRPAPKYIFSPSDGVFHVETASKANPWVRYTYAFHLY